jgi:hypothetical protein
LAKFVRPLTDFFLFFEPGGRPRRFAFFAMIPKPRCWGSGVYSPLGPALK